MNMNCGGRPGDDTRVELLWDTLVDSAPPPPKKYLPFGDEREGGKP